MNQVPRWVIIVGSIILFLILAWYFSNIVAYILVAGVLSIIGRPIVNFLVHVKIKKYHIPRSIASALTMILMGFVFLLFISIFIPLIANEAQAIASINVKEVANSLEEPIARAETFAEQYGLLEDSDMTLMQTLQQKLKNLISLTNVSTAVNNILGMTGNVVIGLFSIAFILFFFLKDRDLFYRILMALVPSERERNMNNALTSIKHLLTRYFVGIIVQITIIVTVLTIGLSIIGLKNALLIAFFAGIFNVIPYVGPIIGATLGLLLGVTTSLPMELYPDLTWLVVKIAAVFACAQLLDNFVLQPLIFSTSVKAHPLEIFVVILAGGSMGGIAGMILAIPAYTVFRVVAKEFFSEFKLVQKLTQNI